MAWEPDEEGLTQVLEVLRMSQNPDSDVQQHVHQQIIALKQYPEFNKYLCFVLTHMPAEGPAVRAVAGLIIKNNIRSDFVSVDVLEYVKQEVLAVIGDESRLVQATVGAIVTTACVKWGVSSWPDLLPTLLILADSEDVSLVEGAFGALQKICEDSQPELVEEQMAETLNVLIGKIIPFFEHSSVRVRASAVVCCSQFIHSRSNIILLHLEQFVENIFKLASDDSEVVRKHVCHALVALFDARIEQTLPMLVPHMDDIIMYMLQSTQGEDEDVALVACEFWISIAEQPSAQDFLVPHLGNIFPTLLARMCYTEDDLAGMEGANEEDAHIPDQASDVRPSTLSQRRAKNWQDENETDEEGSSCSELDEEDGQASWNIRKCAAAALDVIATKFQEDVILPAVLPLLQELLVAPDWIRKEAGILALGAIADGCMEAMERQLDDVTPFLLISLSDERPLVRSITCWTLSRYCRWIVSQGVGSDVFQKLVELLLARILDGSKRVQQAACSAFATLEEEAGKELVPFLPYILQAYVEAFARYQHKNLLILYDAIGTLADSIEEDLNKPEFVEVLMPPLIANWNRLADDDRDLFALLECLSSVAQAMGDGFIEYAPPVYGRCLSLIEQNFEQSAIAGDDLAEAPDKEFIVVALDLLSSLAEGLDGAIESLVEGSNMFQLLFLCMRDSNPDVRQSSFALLGDLAKVCFPHMEAFVEDFLPVLAENLDTRFSPVCNNAVWAIGEIAMNYGERMTPHLGSILPVFVNIVMDKNIPKTLRENCAIALGRLGLVCTEQVAPHLASFAQEWCTLLYTILSNEEKDSAFRGMCAMIKCNPAAIFPPFIYFCNAINTFQNPSPPLMQNFYEILHWFKASMGPERWGPFLQAFPPKLRDPLVERFNLL